MEWLTTTARTVEEAQARALDLLGVDHADAEVQVLEEGKTGLFGRTKAEARVRARIKPKAPPAKDERRSGGGRSGGGDRNRSRGNNRNRGGNDRGGNDRGGNDRNKSSNNNDRNDRGGRGGKNQGSNKNSGGRGQGGRSSNGDNRRDAQGADAGSGENNNRASQRRQQAAERTGAVAGAGAGAAAGRSGGRDSGGRGGRRDREDREEMPVAEQRETLSSFVEGVAAFFDKDATVELVEEGTTLQAQVRGNDLGRLVGAKASTLQAFEELSRTAMHRAAEGRRYHRIQVDVDDYKARRREALSKFATDTAEKVVATGERVAMEPMGAADRKLIHDAVATVPGAETMSEGRDPRRYIVITASGSDEEE